MTRRAVRLRDVAEAAGTSIKTASRVINGDPRVAPATRARVQEAVDAMGYRVDVMARTLRRGIDDTIGVIVPTIGDLFFAAALEEIEMLALERGINLLVASNSANPAVERSVVDGLLARRVAGLIVVPFSTDYGFLTTVRTPAVFMDRHPVGLETGVVMVDDVAGADQCVRHLAAHGHERIALLLDELTIETSARRRDGYLHAHAALGLPVDESLIITGLHDAAAGERAVRDLLSRPNGPTAIFSARSEISLGAVRSLHLSDRNDMAIMSFGDFANADLLRPGVSVMDHNPRVLARAAMERLLLRLDGVPDDANDVIVPLHVILRGSAELQPPAVTEGAVA